MNTRTILQKLRQLPVSLESVGLYAAAAEDRYFCTPENGEIIARLGCDGVHFVLLPEDERVFCVDPAMGDIGTYVLPVAADGETFLRYLLYCRDANPLTQLHWMDETRFRALLAEDGTARWPGCETFYAEKAAALQAIAEAFGLAPQEPFAEVKALQASFDPSVLHFSDEYYDVLGLERE